MCRNSHNLKAVNLMKLLGGGLRSTSHTGKTLVKTEIVLNGDLRVSPAFFFYQNSFFGFDCLVQTAIISAAVHKSASKLINDNNFSIFYNIVPIFKVKTMGP